MNTFAKWRYGPLLDHMVDHLEFMRVNSKNKALAQRSAENSGKITLANKLSGELASESKIFYATQNSISFFCEKNGLKDPFST